VNISISFIYRGGGRQLSWGSLVESPDWNSCTLGAEPSGAIITLGAAWETLARSSPESADPFILYDLRCAIVTSFLGALRCLLKLNRIYECEREPRK
jgi:hypothetical protein